MNNIYSENQMNVITISAPGKLMIMGEHAVVYGCPCIVTAVDWRMKVTVEVSDQSIFRLESPNVNISQYQKPITELGNGEIPKGAKFAEIAVRNFIDKYKVASGLTIKTQSDFSSNFGFGSSSAVTVGTIKALEKLFEIPLTQKELFDLSYKTVLDVQGVGSGFDVAAAIYGGTIYFQNKGEIIEQLNTEGLNLIVGYSGVKADTVAMINLVSEKLKNYKEGVENIFDNIGKLVNECKMAVIDKDWERLGTLMDYNQNYLEDLGVSTDKLNLMIDAAKGAGAYGAKLSGAGGGDCMIAIVSSQTKEKVQEAIKNAGGKIIKTDINTQGVRIEL